MAPLRGEDFCTYHMQYVKAQGMFSSDQDPAPADSSPAEGEGQGGVQLERSTCVGIGKGKKRSARSRMREAADEEVDANIEALLDARDHAARQVPTSCPSCGKRHSVTAPDHRVRLDAVEKLMSLGYGRAREDLEHSSISQAEAAVLFAREHERTAKVLSPILDRWRAGDKEATYEDPDGPLSQDTAEVGVARLIAQFGYEAVAGVLETLKDSPALTMRLPERDSHGNWH
jgi:hypothetical protein